MQNIKDSIRITAQFLKLEGHYGDAEEIIALVEKLEKAVEALQYYADTNNYYFPPRLRNDPEIGILDKKDIDRDFGSRARYVLGKINGIE